MRKHIAIITDIDTVVGNKATATLRTQTTNSMSPTAVLLLHHIGVKIGVTYNGLPQSDLTPGAHATYGPFLDIIAPNPIGTGDLNLHVDVTGAIIPMIQPRRKRQS